MKLNNYYIKAAGMKINKEMINFEVSKEIFQTASKEYHKIKFEYVGMEVWFDFVSERDREISIDNLIKQMRERFNTIDRLLKTKVTSEHITFIASMLTHKLEGQINVEQIMQEVESYVEGLTQNYNYKDVYIRTINEMAKRHKKRIGESNE